MTYANNTMKEKILTIVTFFFYKKTKSNKYTYKDIGFLTSFENANM